jgi:hypothetical protein
MNSQSSKFVYAMTANGAVSLATPDPAEKSSGRMSLFFKSVRGLNAPRQYQYMTKAAYENIVDTFLLSFHIRDCRGGKGERELGRRCLIWLFINYPHLFTKVAKFIPEYGRWDDLLQFFPGVLDLSDIDFVRANYVSTVPDSKHLIVLQTLQHQIVKQFARKIQEDYELMLKGEPCSLAAKWSPTEGDSLDRKSGVFKLLATEIKVSPRVLRKQYLSPLRAYLNVVERYMCDREWDGIDYNKVPSCAMKRLKKSFIEHDGIRFKKWLEALKNNPSVAKVNARQLYPHELVKEMRKKGLADGVCNAQWKIIEDECMKTGSLDNDLVVVDTSMSMQSSECLPFDVACAMGLLISKCSTGKFKHHVLTFNNVPEFVILKDCTLYNRWHQLSTINWGGNTNIQATFELILARGIRYGLTQDDMPKRLWIVSDMQFDSCNGLSTNFEKIEKMYASSGYTRPRIVFWNVVGSSSDFPVSVADHGTVMISGFSPSVMKAVLDGDDSFSPCGIMRLSLDDERLRPIREALDDGEVK